MPRPADSTREVGARAEAAAVKHLRKQGYRILDRNYRSPSGKEVDIIAWHRDTLVFVEVKAAAPGFLESPVEQITRRKRAHLEAAAMQYAQSRRLGEVACRFDVVEVALDERGRPGGVRIVADAFWSERKTR